jgi:hypothetical protein
MSINFDILVKSRGNRNFNMSYNVSNALKQMQIKYNMYYVC